ncbi:MAG: O-antigen ligase family protein [Betaproteobacteria bacterium]
MKIAASAPPQTRLVRFAALSWGFCAFFPVGVMYLNLLLMALAIVLTPGLSDRVRVLRASPLLSPLLLMLAWTLLAALVGGMFPDLPTRVFHVFRVVLVLCLALMLTRQEARHALLGLLVGALFASALVAVHHAWGLPEWAIWRSLIAPHNNFSSGNMMTMAIAAGVAVCLALRPNAEDRWLAFAAAIGLGTTVALHAVSRNAQVLLVLAPMTAIVYRFRSWRAVLAGSVLLATLVVLAWHLSPTIERRFAEISSNLHTMTAESRYNTSIGVRWRMDEEAFAAMVEHPVFGQGVGSWSPNWQRVWAQLDQQLPPDESTRFAEINNPHNDFLLAGMETGVPGLLIVFWLFWRLIRIGWRQRNTAGGITVMMAVSIAASAMVNAPLRDAALGMTLLWLLGASVAAHPEKPIG